MTRRRHLLALAALVEDELAAAPSRFARRVLEPRIRWAAETGEADPEALEVIERCRDRHLASLDADDGLLVLGLSWREIAEFATRSRADVARCRRCGARLPQRPRPCGRCNLAR